MDSVVRPVLSSPETRLTTSFVATGAQRRLSKASASNSVLLWHSPGEIKMADVKNLTVNVAVERSIQKAMADAVQDIFDEHGLMINSIRFEWLERMDGKAFLASTEMDSKTRR